MSFMDIAKSRHSIRSFKDKPVEKEKILSILEAGRTAPSGCNLQPWYFMVIQDSEVKERMSAASRYLGSDTPVLIVICGDHGRSWKRRDGKDSCDIDAAIATDHMTLAAADLGLGTCWVCAFDEKVCRDILGIPDKIEPIAILRLGYPEEDSINATSRKELGEIVCWDRFDKQ